MNLNVSGTAVGARQSITALSMKRPEYSVILITRSTVFRLDCRGKYAQETAYFSQAETTAESSLGDAVGIMLEPENPIGRKTVVLSTAVWNQVIEVPKLSLDGVDDSEKESALKYEAETLAGMSADAIALGCVAASGDDTWSRFWINVASEAEWNEAARQLTAAGARQVRLMHPAGAGMGQRIKIDGPHIEFWENQAIHFSANGTLVATAHAGLDSERWITELSLGSWENVIAKASFLIEPNQCFPADRARPKDLVELSKPAELREWMHAVAQRIHGADPHQLPIIGQRKTEGFRFTGWLAKAALLLIAIGFCGWHWAWLVQRQQTIQQSISAIQQPALDKRKFDAQLKGVIETRTQVAGVAANTQIELRRVQFLVERQTGRFPILLELLADLRSHEMVIRQITPHEKGTTLSGVSLNSESASTMAQSLRELALPLGWKTHPATQQGEKKMINGGPWTFSILLEDIGPGITAPVEAQANQSSLLKPQNVNKVSR